jgi:hypothetical protein
MGSLLLVDPPLTGSYFGEHGRTIPLPVIRQSISLSCTTKYSCADDVVGFSRWT